jgi:hypothetical protein
MKTYAIFQSCISIQLLNKCPLKMSKSLKAYEGRSRVNAATAVVVLDFTFARTGRREKSSQSSLASTLLEKEFIL